MDIRLESKTYLYTQDKEIIAQFIDIINSSREFEKVYTNDEMERIQSMSNKMPFISFTTGQVPGNAWSLEYSYKNGKCVLIDPSTKKEFDITYIIFRVITDGIPIK